MSPSAERTLTIASGDGQDVCPLCRIWRMNAGYDKATCGDGYLKPGCFLAAASSSVAPDPKEPE